MLNCLGDIRKIYMEVQELQRDASDIKVYGLHQDIAKDAVTKRLERCYNLLQESKEIILKEFGK